MPDRLVGTMIGLSERGTPRGATAVLEDARRQAETASGAPSRPPVPRRMAPVLAFAAVVLVTVGGLVALLAVRDSDPDDTPTTEPTVPSTTTTTVPEDAGVSAPVGAADDVAEVAAAPDGRLWAATSVGVVMWDVEAASPTVFTKADGLGGRSVDHVAVGPDGTVWAVGDSWLASYDGTWTVVGGDLPSGRLTPTGDLAVGPDGAAWIASEGDALFRVDGAGTTTFRLPDRFTNAEPWAHSLAVAPDGTVWASTWESGVLAFDSNSGEWQRFGTDDGLPSEVVGNIAVTPGGTVWVGGDGSYGEPAGDIPGGGILRYRDGGWTVFTTDDGLLGTDGEVTADPTGGVWVVHHALPDEVAEALGVELPEGTSHFDGTTWRHYDAVLGRGQGGVTADGTLWLPSPEGITGFDGTSTTHLTAGPDAVPPPVAGEPVHLDPAEGIEPTRLSTSIGEIEFTTWAAPETETPPNWLYETEHGVAGRPLMGGSPMWSADGTTWSEIVLPAGTYFNAAASTGDDLFVLVEDGVARMSWDGEAWTETDVVPPDGALQVAAGPAGVVVAGLEQIHSWDGEQFTPASQPPDKSLHPEGGIGCSAPGRTGSGIMAQLGPLAATDSGFIALAASSEANWYRDPVCEPLVWRSADGDVWTPTSDESPFGARAFVHDLAVVGDLIVVVGGVSRSEAAVWSSEDGGITWQRPSLDAAELWQVAGGSRGWVALGHSLPDGTLGEMWFSPDGITWDGPYQRPLGWGSRAGMAAEVAMLDDEIIGVGKQFDSPGQAWDSAPERVVVGEFIDE